MTLRFVFLLSENIFRGHENKKAFYLDKFTVNSRLTGLPFERLKIKKKIQKIMEKHFTQTNKWQLFG